MASSLNAHSCLQTNLEQDISIVLAYIAEVMSFNYILNKLFNVRDPVAFFLKINFHLCHPSFVFIRKIVQIYFLLKIFQMTDTICIKIKSKLQWLFTIQN